VGRDWVETRPKAANVLELVQTTDSVIVSQTNWIGWTSLLPPVLEKRVLCLLRQDGGDFARSIACDEHVKEIRKPRDVVRYPDSIPLASPRLWHPASIGME
jgi:hypothetical protein